MCVFMVEPVRRVYFDSPYLDKQRLTVLAGQPVDVRCIAVGGNPPPIVDVYLDWFNLTRLFDLRRSFQLRERKGLRAMDVMSVLETRRFVARVRDHALTLHCRSWTSSDDRPVVSNVTLFVNCQYYCHSPIRLRTPLSFHRDHHHH